MSELERFFVHGAYLVAAALFILGLRRMSRVRTARVGNIYAAAGMLIAVVVTLAATTHLGWAWIVGGLVLGSAIGALVARRVEMTAMPELVAFFNGLGGAASAAVAMSFFFALPLGAGRPLHRLVDGYVILVLYLSVTIGLVTLSGSLVAFGKLSGRLPGRAMLLWGRHPINAAIGLCCLAACSVAAVVDTSAAATITWFLVAAALSLLLGVLLVIPIGGADMPVVISLLNAYSGIAASMAGFVLLARGEPSAYMLVISGALVGAAGLILTGLMCRAMNRSLINVLLGGFGETASGAPGSGEYEGVKSFTAEEAALILEAAQLVIVVPGYGLAVAQAQHALAELAQLLQRRGSTVKHAIHPVAGRMPGHMNVLLAEANVPYEQLFDLDEINPEFSNAQVALVVGANDVTNPAASTDPQSPIAGMPILDCHQAQNVIVIKRSLSPGYAGIKNSLFEHERTMMLFADAKQALQEIARELKAL